MQTRKSIAAAAMTAALAGGALIGATLGNPLGAGASGGAGATTTTTAPSGSNGSAAPKPDGPRGPRGGFDLDVAAKTLNLTTDELRTQLQAGKSLADIAKAQGVEKQTLIDALVKAGEARLDEAKAALPDQVAKMVDATPPKGGMGEGHGPGGMGGPGGHHGAGLDAAAKALGMTTEDLQTALKDGKTLAEVATSKGVDKQKVIDALVADAKTHLAQEVKDGKLTQAEADKRLAEITKRITTMVDEGMPKGPMGGPGGPMGGHDGPPPADGGN